jgi:MFS transporter, CP family, cyanate transporter
MLRGARIGRRAMSRPPADPPADPPAHRVAPPNAPPSGPPRSPASAERAATTAAALVIAAGVCAALHVGKLAPAIVTLQAALGLSLVQAGFLLSTVQLAGMALGVAFGAVADGLGLRRSLILGLGILAAASAAGALADGAAALLMLRAIEGLGFLLVVLPAPGLVRQLVAPHRVSLMLGVWGAYMPGATALALLIGPAVIAATGWQGWWWALAVLTAMAALAVARGVPAPGQAAGRGADRTAGAPATALRAAVSGATASRDAARRWLARLRDTLGHPGPWLVATAFAMYSGQWLAVIGFLPTIYAAAGVPATATGVLTAGAAAVNILGNLLAGRALHRGTPPPTLLAIGYGAMGLAAVLAFAGGEGAPPWLRYGAVLAFSMLGGLIPATLFSLAVRLAPGPRTLSTTVGWVQQWSSFGQFAGPPLVAWVASRAGGWQWTGAVTGALSVAGLGLTALIARRLARTSTR